MTTMASQITSFTVVYSTVYSDADQRKHQSSASLAFVWGIHRDRWIPRTKGQLRGKCFHLMTSSCTSENKHIHGQRNRWQEYGPHEDDEPLNTLLHTLSETIPHHRPHPGHNRQKHSGRFYIHSLWLMRRQLRVADKMLKQNSINLLSFYMYASSHRSCRL